MGRSAQIAIRADFVQPLDRPDRWQQATTVGYVNGGLTLYFLCSPESQKAHNLAEITGYR